MQIVSVRNSSSKTISHHVLAADGVVFLWRARDLCDPKQQADAFTHRFLHNDTESTGFQLNLPLPLQQIKVGITEKEWKNTSNSCKGSCIYTEHF